MPGRGSVEVTFILWPNGVTHWPGTEGGRLFVCRICWLCRCEFLHLDRLWWNDIVKQVRRSKYTWRVSHMMLQKPAGFVSWLGLCAVERKGSKGEYGIEGGERRKERKGRGKREERKGKIRRDLEGRGGGVERKEQSGEEKVWRVER